MQFPVRAFRKPALAAVIGAILCLAAVAPSRALDMSQGRLNDLASANGFCIGQRISIEKVAREFPELRGPLLQAETVFRVRMGPGCDHVRATLIRTVGEGHYAEMSDRATDGVLAHLAASSFGYDAARVFVDTLNARAQGDIPSPVIETMLAARYDKAPEQEILNGFTSTYSSADHPKSLGVDLLLSLPLSWKAEDGQRPHVLKQWTSLNGHGMEAINVVIRDLQGYSVTRAEVEEVATMDQIGSMLPGGARPISVMATQIDGEEAILVEFDFTVKRLSADMIGRAKQLMVFHRGKMILLGCMTMVEASDGTLAARYEKMVPVCDLVDNSLVLRSKYQ